MLFGKARAEILLNGNWYILEFNTMVIFILMILWKLATQVGDNSIWRNTDNMDTCLEFYYYWHLQLGRIPRKKIKWLLLELSYLSGRTMSYGFFVSNVAFVELFFHSH
jgi:hypothetical protein